MKYTLLFMLMLMVLHTGDIFSQNINVRDLDFLIGKWEVREDNFEKNWWEKTTRIGKYVMDSSYIELESTAVSSDGKHRTYRWYIHYNSKDQRFEMLSMFGNWHKVQFDILSWDPDSRVLTMRSGSDPGVEEYHERFGEISFDDKFSQYEWKGENKYGDPKNPGIWKYVEKGKRVE
ncbi:MAG: hypothetical protein KDC99_13235 [Cyclobacteriaceae bacterium]|nr:hypothetical protein [Cyclobacteriaceae bacterium]